jgi:hypothetical protein
MSTRGVVAAVVLFAGLALTIGCEGASATPLGGAMRSHNVLRISNDRGGYVIQYAMRLHKYKEAGTRVEFTGRCLSACTLYLALPRSQTCVARGASFSFHAPYGAGPKGNRITLVYMMNKYPDWVRSWIKSHGGLSGRLITMQYGYASRYLTPCETATAASPPRAVAKKEFRLQRSNPTKINFAKARSTAFADL